MSGNVQQGALEQARHLFQDRAWGEAFRMFVHADQASPLGPDDLDRMATSAYLTGRDRDYDRSAERAYHACLTSAQHDRAARCALWLGLALLLRDEPARANGWLSRAQRLVEGRDCVERGYLLLPIAEQQLAEKNGDAALTAAGAAGDIADRFGDAELAACARHLQGRARIEQGHVQQGLGLLDEAMVAVSGGELSPIVTGLIYCSVIDACRSVFALGRAREWTQALSLWCEQQPEMVAFSGTCRVHRAEVMQLRGAWTEALREAGRAVHRVVEGERSPPAAAYYRQGEIHRLRGEFAAAETAYREASRLGAEPLPGLALLRLAQGRTDVAYAAIRRACDSATEPLQRARLLPSTIEIALAAGDVVQARAASGELEVIASRYGTDVLRTMALHARGTVELAAGDARGALGPLRDASTRWQRGEAPYEEARARVLIARACRELGDGESADLELDAARATFERLGAAPDLARLDALRERTGRATGHGLTPREQQVLRQVAAGRTNKAIATALRVSERTVDRHVSQILSKLGVPSRSAATAYAYSHDLI